MPSSAFEPTVHLGADRFAPEDIGSALARESDAPGLCHPTEPSATGGPLATTSKRPRRAAAIMRAVLFAIALMIIAEAAWIALHT